MTFVLVPTSTSVPYTEEQDGAAGIDITKGALVVKNGTGQFAECGADPASIWGVSVGSVGPDASGFNILGTLGFPPGKVQAMYAKDQVFSAEYTGALPANPGGSFGVVKGGDGLWRVDFGEAVNTRVSYVGPVVNDPSATNPLRVKVRFLAANVQAA